MKQTANRVIMVRPANFGANPETADSNAFQHELIDTDRVFVRESARAEFLGAVKTLRAAGVDVRVEEELGTPKLPDSVFPNNWFSTHEDGTLVLYPMASALRRHERHPDLISAWKEDFKIQNVFDLTSHESEELFLEGTGSLVLDRQTRVAYAAVGPRTNAILIDKWCEKMGYRACKFDARDTKGFLIYHTNVVMAIGEKFAVVCLDSIEVEDRFAVTESLETVGKDVVEISLDQVEQFAGNILELDGDFGPVIVASATAWNAFSPEQQTKLAGFGKPVVLSIETIEKYGGGSARCMIAECFWEKLDGWF